MRSNIVLLFFIALTSSAVTYVITETVNKTRITDQEKRLSLNCEWENTVPSSEPRFTKSFRPLSNPTDVTRVPAQLWKSDDEFGQMVVEDDGYFYFLNATGEYSRITYYDHPVSGIKLDPEINDKIGFYYYPDGESLKVLALVIMDIYSGEMKEVYRKDIRTSAWKWDGSDRVIVYYNCGTTCMHAYKIDVNTGKTVDEYPVIIGQNEL